MTDLRFVTGIDILDGLSDFEQFRRLNKLYVALLEAGEKALTAEERRTLLELVRRLLGLVDSADLFLQTCQEQTQQLKGVAEFDKRLQELLASDALGSAVKERLSGKDLVQLAEQGAQDYRAFLADERERLQSELLQLQAEKRPVRSAASDDISSDAELGAGVAFEVAGAAMVVAAALAPKTAGASIVVGIAVGGLAVEAGGLLLVVDAVLH